jgi:hypothetical protein
MCENEIGFGRSAERKTNFSVFCPPHHHRAQNFGWDNTAQSFYTARVIRDRVEPAAGPAMSAVAPFATNNSLPTNGALALGATAHCRDCRRPCAAWHVERRGDTPDIAGNVRFAPIVLQNNAAFFIWADLRIAQLVAFSAGSVLRHYRPTRLVDRLRRTGDCRRWRRAAEEFDEAPQVLSGCGQ